MHIWQSLEKFCDDNFADVKFRNDSMRKAFLVRKGIQIQQDDKGRDEVCTPKSGSAEEKEIKIGKRLAASKVRQMDCGDGSDFSRSEIAELHEKQRKGLKVNANSKDACQFVCVWAT